MKKFIICFVLFGLTHAIFSKEPNLSLRFKLSYNSFDMHELKDFQTTLASVYRRIMDIPVKEFENFPNYFGLQLEFYNQWLKGNPIGIYVEYTSTGSRIHYSDYSGMLNIDQIINRISLGVCGERCIYPFKSSNIMFNIYLGLIRSNYSINEKLKIGENALSTVTRFYGYSIGIEPNLSYQLSIHSYMFLIGIGYQIDFPIRNLKSDEYELRDSRNNSIYPGWRGLRLNISIGYNF